MKHRLLIKFGQKIRTERLKRGLSQEAFAAKAHVHRTYIARIERGESNVALLNIKKIADTLGVDLIELVRL